MNFLIAIALLGMQPPPPRIPQVPAFVAAWVEDTRTGRRIAFKPQEPRWPQLPRKEAAC